MERMSAILSVVLVGSETCVWQTGNHNGVDHHVMCPDGRMVTSIDWEEQSGYGIIGLKFTCHGSESQVRYLGSDQGHNGQYKGHQDFTPVEGLRAVQMKEQDGFGIVDVMTWDGHGNTLYPTHNPDGSWKNKRECPSGEVVSGMGVNYQGGFGIVNFCFTCSHYDYDTEVIGGWEIVQSSPETQSVTITEGVEWSTTVTDQQSYETSVTTTMSEGFKVEDFSAGFSLSTTDAQTMVHTDSHYFSEKKQQARSFDFGPGVVWQWKYTVNRASDAMGSGTDHVFIPQFQLSPSEDEPICCLPGHFVDLTDYQSACSEGPRLCSKYAEMSAVIFAGEEFAGKVFNLHGAGYCHGVRDGSCHTMSGLEFDKMTGDKAFNGARSLIVGPNTNAEVRNYGNGQEDQTGVSLGPGKYDWYTLSNLGITGICVVILTTPEKSAFLV